MLLAGCEQDLARRIDGRAVTVGQAWAVERPLLLALPAEPFDACETAVPRVDAKSLVTIRQNRYSVPVGAGRVEGQRQDRRAGDHDQPRGREVARHERLHGKFGTSAQLDHYLELLQRKPGGLEHSVALSQERDRGCWPECFDRLWAGLNERYGRSDAARQMVDVVLLCREHGPARVELAVRGALGRGRDRRTRRPGSRPPHVEHHARHAGAADRPRRAPSGARAARAGPDRLRPAARRIPMTTTPARNAQTAALEALIEAHAIELKLPTVRRRFKALAAEALREQQTPVAYFGALLEAEMAERAERREKRRLIDARFPQIKRLEDFRFADNPKVPQATIAALAEGSWIDDRES